MSEVIYSRTVESSSGYHQVNICEDKVSEFEKEVSNTLASVLFYDEVNTAELERLRSMVFVVECIFYNMLNVCSVLTGSILDCSALPGSDVDQMAVVRDTLVINDVETELKVGGNVLITDGNDCPAGYTKLIPLKVGDTNKMETSVFLQSYAEADGKSFVSSEKYIMHFVDLVSNMDEFSPPPLHAGLLSRHGPCVLLNYAKYKDVKESDIGIGLKCVAWPDESSEWINRERSQKWPSTSLIDKIKRMPCHILPVGSSTSNSSHLEWRYAFVLPERELIWNFNNTQIQCYVVFKTLIKQYLQPIASDEINSFHLKTIMFWLSEDVDEEMWCPENLTRCVRYCIHSLKQCIKSKHLSHYFLRKRNLLFNRLKDDTKNKMFIKKLEEFEEDIVMSFLKCEDSFKKNKPGMSCIWDSLTPFASLTTFLEISKIRLRTLQNAHKEQEDLNVFRAREVSAEATFATMFMPMNNEQLYSIAETIEGELHDNLIASYCLKFLSIRVGMQFLAEARILREKEARQNVTAGAKWCFETGLEHDSLASYLYLATYQYNVGNYSNIQEFLTKLFKLNVGMIYTGSAGLGFCSRRPIISPDMDDSISASNFNHKDIVFDILFSSSDISCVPAAVKFECAVLEGRSNWSFCMLHPFVYASYMQFQVAFILHDHRENIDIAIKHLADMIQYIERTDDDFHSSIESHRHHNILGYSYFIGDDIDSAAKCFIKSLRMRPTNGNAAVYHLCILVFKCLSCLPGNHS